MREAIDALIANVRKVIFIKTETLEYLVAALVAGGHVMLADSHGVGKTSLAKALAGSIRWPDASGAAAPENAAAAESASGGEAPVYRDYNRVQCTVDLLPQDILGYSRVSGADFAMSFRPGPIFSRFLLCDEINLLPPKTQGSFFQAMEEKLVTVDGRTWALPDTFFLISTMNLKGAHLFPLPLPQLDRFMVQLSLGFPDFDDETAIVGLHGQDRSWDGFGPAIDYADLLAWMAAADRMELHPDVLAYIVRLVRATRDHPDLAVGASPRSGIKISRLVRALAVVRGKPYVRIDDVKEAAVAALAHRIETRDAKRSAAEVVRSIVERLDADPAVRALLKRA
jgi:MoxR-like ATPase